MPMHDWTRADPRDYHSFHNLWLAGLTAALNSGVLPGGYFAATDYSIPLFAPDIATLEHVGPANRPTTPAQAARPAAASATAVAPVRPMKQIARRRVAVVEERGRRLVAVIELVSPSNKKGRAEFNDLIAKAVQLVNVEVSLLLIDPFPPTPRDPAGLHAAFWKALTRRTADARPAGKPLTVASYATDDERRCSAYVTPLAVGDPLPDPPLFLRPDLPVQVPLAATYDAAWAGFPGPLKPLVEVPPSPA